MNIELKILENKLQQSLITDDDVWRINALEKKYAEIFDEFVDYHLLYDRPDLQAIVKDIVREFNIEEYFLNKKLIDKVYKALQRALN